MPTEFDRKVWLACKRIPKGRISTYKELANFLHSKAYRAVGSSLRRNPYAPLVPCHRVVASDGKLGGYAGRLNSDRKVKLLRNEGITVSKGRIINFIEKKFYFRKPTSR